MIGIWWARTFFCISTIYRNNVTTTRSTPPPFPLVILLRVMHGEICVVVFILSIFGKKMHSYIRKKKSVVDQIWRFGWLMKLKVFKAATHSTLWSAIDWCFLFLKLCSYNVEQWPTKWQDSDVLLIQSSPNMNLIMSRMSWLIWIIQGGWNKIQLWQNKIIRIFAHSVCCKSCKNWRATSGKALAAALQTLNWRAFSRT